MFHSTHSILSFLCSLCLITFGSSKEYENNKHLVNPELKNNLRTRLLDHKQCLLDVDIRCMVVGEDQIGVGCDDFVSPVLPLVQCEQTPLSATMLLRGDRCDDSATSDLSFECQDQANSSKLSHDGDWMFIVATDAAGQGIVYHRDWVRVGDYYELSNGLPLEYGVQILTFDDENESNLLQTVTYRESLCSNESELFALLGASQIVDFKDANDKYVAPFQSSSYEVYIDVSISSHSHKSAESIQLESLAVSTSFQGILDFSEELKGAVLESGATYQTRIPLKVNLLEKQDHSLLVQVTGNPGNASGLAFTESWTPELFPARLLSARFNLSIHHPLIQHRIDHDFLLQHIS